MISNVYTFVELSKGQMEDVVYNNVALSNGLRSASVKNNTGKDDLIAKLKEGDKVVCTFETAIVKAPNRSTKFEVVLTDIEKASERVK